MRRFFAVFLRVLRDERGYSTLTVGLVSLMVVLAVGAWIVGGILKPAVNSTHGNILARLLSIISSGF